MAEARSGEDVRSRIGRVVVIAAAGAVAALMVWALYAGSDRTPNVERAAVASATSWPHSAGPPGVSTLAT